MPSSIRIRLLGAFLVVAVASALGLSAYFLTELESYGLRKLEERVISESVVVASVLGSQLDAAGRSGISRQGAEALHTALAATGPSITSRVRVLDGSGQAVADSADSAAVGARYAGTPEVAEALAGRRATAHRMAHDARIELHSAMPVLVDGQVAAVVYTSGTSFSVRTLFRDYRLRLAVAILAFVLLALVLTEMLSRWLAEPVLELARTAVAFSEGDHSVRARARGSSEIRALAASFNVMADEVQTVMTELTEEERRRSRFVSDVSHELRTPLTAIRGAAETLLEGDVPEEEAKQFLSTIVREAERLGRLANDLLTLQRIEGATGELPIARVELLPVVQRAVEGLAPLTEARGVRVLVEGEAPAILGDRDRLQQIVGNLVDNASRMTREGGTVTVRLSAEGREAVVRVLDEGPGIPDEDVSRVFDRFYRAQASRDRSTGGAGLGLAIVAAIVRAHAGTVTVANRPEGGSAFTVRLPAIGG